MVTPGSTISASSARTSATSALARAHLLDLARRLADDHGALPPAAAVLHRAVDRRGDHVGGPVAVDRRAAFRAPRSTPPAACSAAGTPSAAPARCLRRRRCAPPAGRRTSRTSSSSAPRRWRRSGRRSAASPAAAPARPPGRRCRARRAGRVRSIRRSSAAACIDRSREPVEDETRRASSRPSRSSTIAIITSSLTSRPASIAARADAAERRTRLHRLAQDVAGRDPRQRAPLGQTFGLRPFAGAGRAEHHDVETRATAALRPHLLPSSPADACLLHEPVVVPHDELRLDLMHGVHRHADDDQQRGAAEEERDAEAVGDPPRRVRNRASGRSTGSARP